MADQSYYEWLQKQSPEFQDEVLGKTRGKLFRDGGLTPKQFADLQLDRNFKPLTLEDIKAKEPLVFDKAFDDGVKTVHDGSFKQRFNELKPQVKGYTRNNSLGIRRKLAKGQKWRIATMKPEVMEMMDVQAHHIWLSDDSLIKMLIHHPEQASIELFEQVQTIINNATYFEKKNDLNVIYFTKDKTNYITTVKATHDKKELYLTSVFKVDEEEFLRKYKNSHLGRLPPSF